MIPIASFEIEKYRITLFYVDFACLLDDNSDNKLWRSELRTAEVRLRYAGFGALKSASDDIPLFIG